MRNEDCCFETARLDSFGRLRVRRSRAPPEAAGLRARLALTRGCTDPTPRADEMAEVQTYAISLRPLDHRRLLEAARHPVVWVTHAEDR